MAVWGGRKAGAWKGPEDDVVCFLQYSSPASIEQHLHGPWSIASQ